MLKDIIKFRQSLTDLVSDFSSRERQDEYRKYLANFRGLPEHIVEETKCFYVYDSYFFHGIDKDLLEKAGFTDEGKNVYRESFVFPVYDTMGLVAGFIGYDADRPHIKYLVSKTLYFHKQLGYGSEYSNLIMDKGFIIFTEGLFDMLALRALGFYNSKAMLGVIPFDYVKIVSSRVGLTVVIPDSDEIGRNSIKSWSNLGNYNITIKLPEEYKDVNDLYKAGYGEKLKDCIKNSIIDFNKSLPQNKIIELQI